MSVNGKPQLASLQLVRAIAALGVVVCHQLGGGFGHFGVDLFFVLSGYVIAMVTLDGVGVGKFIRDRVTRLVPLYWLTTLTVFVLALVMPQVMNSTYPDVARLIKSLLFIPHLKENGRLMPLLALGWTLNYEMFFYVLTAGVLCCTQRHVTPWVILALGLAYGIGTVVWPRVMGIFLADLHLFEFALGMLAFHLQRHAAFWRMPIGLAVGLALAAYVVLSWVDLRHTDRFFLGFGVPSFLFVMAMRRLEPLLARRGTWRRAGVFLGDASYAIYLTHYFTIEVIAKLVAPRAPELHPATWLGGSMTFLLVILVGALTYVLLDKPMVRAARRITGKKPTKSFLLAQNPVGKTGTE